MDNSEFVNQYIEVLTKNIQDLTSKNMILETRAVLGERKLSELNIQHHKLELAYEEIQDTPQKLQEAEQLLEDAVNELELGKIELTSVQTRLRECDDMQSRYNSVVQEMERLRVDFDSVRNDLGIARTRISELDKQNEEILQSNQELRNQLESASVKPATKKTKTDTV